MSKYKKLKIEKMEQLKTNKVIHSKPLYLWMEKILRVK
jgi:hypothetical protein